MSWGGETYGDGTGKQFSTERTKKKTPKQQKNSSLF